MSVRCLAWSEPQTPLLNLGQEEKLLLNGQHQLLRGEDGPHPGQHHNKEGEIQACHGELLHHQGEEHNISGLLHHHKRENQNFPGRRLVQQRHHHYIFPESLLTQAQDALDDGVPLCGVGGLAEKVIEIHYHHSKHTDTTAEFGPRAKPGLNLLLEL